MTHRRFTALSKRADARRRRDELQPALIAATILNSMPNAKRKDGKAWRVEDLTLAPAENEPSSELGPEQSRNFFRMLNAAMGGKEAVN